MAETRRRRLKVTDAIEELERLDILAEHEMSWNEGEPSLRQRPGIWIPDKEQDMWEAIDDEIDRDLADRKQGK